MQPILPLELVGNDKLDFDLYNSKGELIYKNGEDLTPGLLMQLSHRKIFRKNPNDNSQTPIIEKSTTELAPKSVISEKSTNTLIKNTKSILKNVYNNEKVDTSNLTEATNIIIDEVSRNLEKIDCISQLRIFDEYTFSHTVNVSTMSSAIGLILDFSEDEIQELALGALLHDIGKMLVPKDILNKPGKLDEEEFKIMKSHTLLGYNYIKENLDVNDKIAKVALDHQEKYGGGGYPNSLAGKEINLYAQVTTIADVYDALISHRVYKRAIQSKTAIDIMLSEGDKYFNPYMLDKFLDITDYKKESANILNSLD